MFRIIDKRGTGKTGRLMLLAKENEADFVCSNPRAMNYKAKQYDINGINFISYDDFINNGSNRRFIIDELDIFLKSYLGEGLIGYSITDE